MSNVIKLKKGLNIPLQGEAEKTMKKASPSQTYAIKPTDFPGLTPKLSVKEGATVKAGSPLFYDKSNPEVKFTSPVSGEVVAVVRGERRRILEVVVKADNEIVYEEFQKGSPSSLKREEIKESLLTSGLWPMLKMRPYGIVARPADTPKDIFISCFDSAPLASDYEFVLAEEQKHFQVGIDALSKLTDGSVHLGLPADSSNKMFGAIQGVKTTKFSGPHPAGNVGVQIAHISPINKGDIYWTIAPQDVVNIGRLFEKGIYDAKRVIALTGSPLKSPEYVETLIGANISSVMQESIDAENNRIISGDVLTGTQVEIDGHMSFYSNQVTILPEGNYYEMFGWALPGLGKFSPSRTFFSWLGSKARKFTMDTNFHGEERAFVVTGEYEKVLPMDILPVQLFKSILVNDIDKMEQLGIYEVIEEDIALCEYVCTSKIDIQKILRDGINTMIKELG
ncbi:Na(+)-translocating NADH-quinone reductase subunit A [Halosquirtibacter xylanolyticus]|uniref:Na(+)-translocating NADH-quinone reductase subunit A n=1 Tax=Halosquirtibacter xylanolyticus TaxID=3374599 RepID=UPI003747DB8B|nr:Na(+)-translocating NADH-quinone reductase subunit A [Prolixibacteraceae bacterium]